MLPLPLPGGTHLTDREQRQVARWAAQQYRAGRSIRDIAAELGRSYGYTRKLLHTTTVRMRPTGRRLP